MSQILVTLYDITDLQHYSHQTRHLNLTKRKPVFSCFGELFFSKVSDIYKVKMIAGFVSPLKQHFVGLVHEIHIIMFVQTYINENSLQLKEYHMNKVSGPQLVRMWFVIAYFFLIFNSKIFRHFSVN